MRKYIGFSCIAFCLFLAVPQSRASGSCTSIAGNLVANCGFETGDFTSWSLSGSEVPSELNFQYGVEGQDPVDLIIPHSGSDQAFFATLDADATTISQSLATTSGDAYTITFWLAQDTAVVTPYSNELSASFGADSLIDETAVPVEGYTEYSFTEDATSSSTLLSLTLGNDLGEFLLDDVSVVQAPTVPEPPAWTLVLLGMIGSAFLCKRGLVAAE
ncbi:MAG: hypothetical protein ABSG51_17755 [Terracidiphilus sp.]|jgi:hypothetical protein